LPIRSSARDVAQSGELLRLFETQRANVDAIEIPDQREHSQVLTPLDARADYRGDPRPGTTQQANGKSRSSSGSDSGNVRAVHNAGRCAGVGIEQANQGQVVRQVDLQIAVEDVDYLDGQ